MANSNGYFPFYKAGARKDVQQAPSVATTESVDSGYEYEIGQAPFDASDNQDVTGIPDLDQVELWGEEAAAFIASAPGVGEAGWVGKRPLGEGGFGRAGLWELYDAEGNVQRRMVVKENMREREKHDWKSQKPNEVYIMQKLNPIACPSIVKLLNYRRFPLAQTHRLYLEYCPHGDLRKLYKRYKAWRRYLPEPFLWHVFHNMVLAAMAMYCGSGYRELRKTWENDCEVVHRDIKPGNIFLGDEPGPGSDRVLASHYPTAKIGDFGLAIVTSPDDNNNPRNYRRAGTPGYRAPEQESRHQLHNPPAWMADQHDRISSWTNIWAIGAVMYELTTLHRAARVLFNQPDPQGHGCPPIHTNKSPEYSSHLRDLIRACLNMSPAVRPDLAELHNTTRRFARMTRDQLAHLRTAPDEPCEEEKLYYRDNEINDMAPGGDYVPSRLHRLAMHESGFWNPDVSVLRYPNFTPFEDSDQAGDMQDAAEIAESRAEYEQRVRDLPRDEDRGSVYRRRGRVEPSEPEDEDGEMDVDEPTVVPAGNESESASTVRGLGVNAYLGVGVGGGNYRDQRLGGVVNRFGEPRMGGW